MAERTCAVGTCDRLAKTRGWCNRHYENNRLRGNPLSRVERNPHPRVCAITDCDGAVRGRGWCGKHYMRWRTHGDPLASLRPSYGQKRRVGYNGYVYIYRPEHPLAMSDGYVAEHRYVLYEAGVDPTGLHVHHKNENKQDNRLGNLEAVTSQEHRAEHLQPGAPVRNQYGVWLVRRKAQREGRLF